MRDSWQDFNWHDASRGPSAIAELLVSVWHCVGEGAFDIRGHAVLCIISCQPQSATTCQSNTGLTSVYSFIQRSFCKLYSHSLPSVPHALASLMQSKQVCIQPPTSAVNATLLAFAAERSAASCSVTPMLVSAWCRQLWCQTPSSTQRLTLPHGTQQQTRRLAHYRLSKQAITFINVILDLQTLKGSVWGCPSTNVLLSHWSQCLPEVHGCSVMHHLTGD